MVIRVAYGRLIFRIILMFLTCLLASYLLFNTQLFPLAGLVILILILQVVFLIRSLNYLNKKISYFFDAVRNEDATLHFPEDVKSKTEQKLNASLNQVNTLIQEARAEQVTQEKYYEYILEQATTGLMTIDENGHIILSNQAAKDLLGFERLRHISQLSKLDEKVGLAVQKMKPGESTVIQLTNEKETVKLSLKIREITIRDQALRLVALNNIQNELADQEIESWIRLIRVLTHEIMNSVTPITSMAGTLKGVFESPEKTWLADDKVIRSTVKSLDTIQMRGEGLMKFVDAYRKLTKLPEPVKRTIPLHDYLETIRILISQEADFKKVNFKITVAKDMQLVADQSMISQVLINLVKNAIHATAQTTHPQISIEAAQVKNAVMISVRDNGVGMDQETLKQVFIPFFTTKEQGTGIGLSLSQHIMRLHGGRIEVDTTAGLGSTFRLVF
jgi:two-component system nitrogen regulation sensor histidine kinase NtrY